MTLLSLVSLLTLGAILLVASFLLRAAHIHEPLKASSIRFQEFLKASALFTLVGALICPGADQTAPTTEAVFDLGVSIVILFIGTVILYLARMRVSNSAALINNVRSYTLVQEYRRGATIVSNLVATWLFLLATLSFFF